jgi:Protein of unknown function (DUF3795)
MSDRDFAGRCGMYCGSCPIYRASHDKDEKTAFELSFKTRCTLDQIKCEGCGTSDRFPLSKGCVFRKCAKSRDLESCGLCQDFPCDALAAFYGEDMRRNGEAENNARRIKEVGVDKWLEEADARWRCKHCDSKISLDAKACRICKALILPRE